MATIALYAGKINPMPGFVNDIKRTVTDFRSELSALKAKSQQINPGICNLSDVISSIQASSQTQEEKIASLDDLNQKIEQFAYDAACIDDDVADIVRQRQEDFYDKYYYLKPECEKSVWEKIGNKCKKVGEWCKEHWVMLTTIIVVVAIAVIAVVAFGIAVAAVAAIAGIISLVLCAADIICMIATGGKDLSAVFRENGWNVLADIFQGLQIGCDIVSIVLPAGAAIKVMSKIGVGSFVKASLRAFKAAFKEAAEVWGKNSIKGRLKYFGKMAFKTFVFDIDDLTKVKNGKRVWNLKESVPKATNPSKNWTIEGEQLIASTEVIPGKYNPQKLTMAEIMGQEKFSQFPDTIPYKNGEPDLSGFAVAEADINMKKFNADDILNKMVNNKIDEKRFSNKLREMNFKTADEELLRKTGMTKKEWIEKAGFKLTWHEDLNMKKCYLVPTEIHANLKHIGAVGNFKISFKKAPEISKLLITKDLQFGFRCGINFVGAVIGG